MRSPFRIALVVALCASLVAPAASLAAPASSSRVSGAVLERPPIPGLPSGGLVKDAVAGPPRSASTTASVDWLAPAEPDRVLVVFDDTQSGIERVSFSSQVAQGGGEVSGWQRAKDAASVDVPAGESRSTFAEQLQADPAVAWVQPLYRYQAQFVPDDPLYAGQWGLKKIGMEAAWDTTLGASAVTVAVVDTGVDLTHPDLAGQVDTAHDWDFVNGDSSAQDDDGHGTHVAGIVAAATNNAIGVAGVAPGCRILPVKVLDSRGSGDSGTVADGIKYAVDQGAKVINLSLGSASADSYLWDAVSYASMHDVVICAASGNNHSQGGALYPARFEGVIGVAATANDDSHPDFSNAGPGVDIAAPGVDILSTYPSRFVPSGSVEMSGTSMATPFVSGVAALVRSEFPTASAVEVEQRLEANARDLGAPGWDPYFGYGRVRADVSLTAAPPPPDIDAVPATSLDLTPTVTGTLDFLADRDDTYRVDLQAGETLSAQLFGDASTDFDLYLFAPGATSVYASVPIGGSLFTTYPDAITFTAPAAGTYYLDVRSSSGAGSYTLRSGVAVDPDAEVPGTPLVSTPVTGTLTELVDQRDVYRVGLVAGETLDLSLTGPFGTSYAVEVYPPGIGSVSMSRPVVADFAGSYPRNASYAAPTSGTYYVAVRCIDGSGAYALGWSIRAASATVTRVGGATRYEVAADLARRGWDPTGAHAWTGVKHVIVASGEDRAAADPLSAAGLAGIYDAPVLLVRSDPKAALPAATAQVIAEIAARNPGVRVHIVGGTASVPDKTWSRIAAIKGVSGAKDRLAGRDRYAVSAAIANRMLDVKGVSAVPGVLIVNAEKPDAFYDALVASPAAYRQAMPMLAVRTDSVPGGVSALLKGRLAGKPRYVVSSSTFVSEGVRRQVGASERLASTSRRYAAASQIANQLIARGWSPVDDTGLAAKLPDSLTGGTFLGKRGGVLVLTDSSYLLRSETEAFFSAYSKSIENAWILGGTSSVTQAVEWRVIALLP